MQKKDFETVIKVKNFDRKRERILGYPGEPNLVSWILKNGETFLTVVREKYDHKWMIKGSNAAGFEDGGRCHEPGTGPSLGA